MTAPEQRRADALQLIFSLFLGILLVVVIGVGVWTFYPQPFGPNSAEQEQLEELYKQQERLGFKSGAQPMSPADQAESARISEEIDRINDDMSDRRDMWAVGTSVILLSFATVLMAVSLFLPDHMRVFSNGVLLGGVFTVIYGTGWSFAGGDSRARFWVVLVALLLSVVFGYLRFIRGRRDEGEPGARVATTPAAGVDAAAQPVLSELTERVAALEARVNAAADVLGGQPRD